VSLKSRLDKLERLVETQFSPPELTPEQLALDLAQMASSMPGPDAETQERQLAKVDRLQAAVATGDTSGLLPGDTDVLPPAEMIAAGGR